MFHSNAPRLALAILSLTMLPLTATAQVIELTKITDEDTPIRGWGDRPALHAGEVAILADDQATGIDGLYRTSADGTGPFTLIVDELTPVPNRPGSVFDFLDNPAIFDGQVVFTGGDDHDIDDGIYRGSGGPLEVLEDRMGGDPPPARPAVDATGVVFEVDPSFFEPPFFQPNDLSGPFQIASNGSPAPGGGTFATFDHIGSPAIGGGLVSFTAWVAQPSGDQGVYTHDPASGTLDWIANGSTVIPGTALTFESFSFSDTDGDVVVFEGHEGYLCCGGQGGVYLAPAASSGAGPFTIVAEVGQPVPGNPNGATFSVFHDVAVDGDLVVLMGLFYDPITGNSESGLYGFRDGALFKILDSTDTLGGWPLIDASFTHRSLDDNQLVFRARYEDPGANWGQGLAVWVATILPDAAVALTAEPVNAPIVIGSSGGSFRFSVTLTNTSSESQAVQAWSEATGPINRNPVLAPRTVTLPAGATVTRTLTQQVPAAAPAGTYTYTVSVGTFGSAVLASASFPVDKDGVGIGSRSAADAPSEWWVRGWDTSEATSQAGSLPAGFALSAVYPNPFSHRAQVMLEVAEAQAVRVEIYDALGRRVAVLHDGVLAADGPHTLTLDAAGLPSAVYVVRVTGEAFDASRRLTLLR